mgnify:CR=1 FL=1
MSPADGPRRMESCHTPRPGARRSFIVTPYQVGDDGVFVPAMPRECLRASAECDGDGCVCRIGLHHWRQRKTGPGFPLVVGECRTHHVAFTLYPPGHVPYGRVAIAPVDPEGRLLREPTEHEAREVAGSVEGDSDAGSLAWGATLFRAAQDAAQGVAWPRVSSGAEGWRTQGRWIVLGATILGLTSPAAEGSIAAGLLGVSALTQREATAAYATASGYRGRGQAVTRPLVELEQAGVLALDWLLDAGFVMTRWGPPRRLDPRFGRLRRLAARARAP